MSKYTIKPKVPKYQAVIGIIFALVFMGIASSMFSQAGGGLFAIPFFLIPLAIIFQSVKALTSKDSTIPGGYVIESDDHNEIRNTSSSNYANTEEKLKKLKELKYQGLIDEDDYDRKVNEILDNEF